MDFIDTLPSLAAFNENLPYPDNIAEAYWLAELACMCHDRIKGNPSNPAGFWGLLDVDDAKRLKHFLRDAGNGVSELANDLQMLVDRDSAGGSAWPKRVPFDNCVEEMFFLIEKLGRDYPDKPEMVAEVRANYAKFLQECNAVLEVG